MTLFIIHVLLSDLIKAPRAPSAKRRPSEVRSILLPRGFDLERRTQNCSLIHGRSSRFWNQELRQLLGPTELFVLTRRFWFLLQEGPSRRLEEEPQTLFCRSRVLRPMDPKGGWIPCHSSRRRLFQVSSGTNRMGGPGSCFFSGMECI